MKRFYSSVAFCYLFLVAVCPGIAQQQTLQAAQSASQEIPALSIENIRGNIYQVKGGMGANSGFIVGKKGVVVLDAKMTGDWGRKVVSEIKRVTPNPIGCVILTHSDSDHVNGLVGFPQGLSIISHEKTRLHMDRAFQTAVERAYLPGITFSDRMSLYVPGVMNEIRMDLLHFGPAHTDGDLVVYFPEEKVAFIGDLIFIDRDQLIHRHKNGNSFGLVKTLKAILTLDADVFVSGHSDPATTEVLRNHIKGIEEKQAGIEALVKEGKSLGEVKKIYNVQAGVAARWPSLVEVIYRELTERR